jgi:hypothetical protein
MKQAEKAVMETESRQLYRKLTEKAIGLIAEVGALVTIMLIYIHAYIHTQIYNIHNAYVQI